MTFAVKYWQQVFEETEMHHDTYKRIKQLRAKDTRVSQKSAHELGWGAFSAFLHKTYGVPQLAKALLKYPAVAPGILLKSWTEYKQSTQYQLHKQRSAHPSSLEYLPNDERRARQTTVYRLRHLRRQALRLENRIWQGYDPEFGRTEEENSKTIACCSTTAVRTWTITSGKQQRHIVSASCALVTMNA